MASLRVQIYDHITQLNADDWRRLFPSLPDTYATFAALDHSGMEGFTFGSIVVRDGDAPILAVPIFRTTLKLETLTRGRLRTMLNRVVRVNLLKYLLHVRVLGIGLIEGEWSEIGYDRNTPTAVTNSAFTLAESALDEMAAQSRSQLILCLNFAPDALQCLSEPLKKRFTRIDTYPCAYLPVSAQSIEAYISSLSKNARKDIRKKLRTCGEIRIERPRNIDVYATTIYQLYADTVDHAELALGHHCIGFFTEIMRLEPQAQFVLYWIDEELIAFNLLIRQHDRLIDKYFCMKRSIGRDNHLYFVSWIENVRYCIEHHIDIYHAGPGAESTKARLGAKFVHSTTLFRHRNPIVHAVLKRLRRLFAYQPSLGDTVGADTSAQFAVEVGS